MISQQLAQLVEALHQQKEETREHQAAFEARLSQQQQDINQSSVSIHGLVHTLMDQTNKQLGLMGIGGISPIPSNASSSLDHHPNGLLPMRQGVEGTTGSIAQSQGSSEPVGLDSGLMSDVEDHLGPSPQPQVDIDVAIPPCGDEVIDHLRALKEEDKTTKTTSTQPTPTHGSSLPSTFSLPYTPSNHAPARPAQPVSSTAIFQYPKRYHRSGDNNRFYRQPDLIFPEALPHRQETHYSGRWIINPDMRKVWVRYDRALSADELPANVPTNPAHWVNRRYPDGLFFTDQGEWIISDVRDRFFNHDQPPTHTPVTTGLTPTTAYTSPGYQTVPMEEPSKQVDSDIVRPRSKPSLFSNLEGTSPMDKVTQGRIPDRFGDPGDPGGSGYHGGDGNHRGFSRKGRYGGPPGGGPPGDPWDPDGGGDPPAGPGGGGGGDGPRRKLFHAKPDANAYPTLKSNKDFDQWYTGVRGDTQLAHLGQYSTTKGSAVEFIIHYDEVLTRYNDSKTNEQDKLSDSIQKLFLQQAFIDIKVLNDISAREQENMCSNGAHMSYSYEKYKEVLTNAATRFDVNHKLLVPTGRSCRANMAVIDESEDDAGQPDGMDTMDDLTHLQAFAAIRDPSVGLPDQHWTQHSSTGKKNWHQFDDHDKKVLMESKPPAPTSHQVNVANSMTDPDSEADPAVGDTPGPSLDVNQTDMTPSVGKPVASPSHSASQAKANDKHPGDVRRMMSNTTGKRQGYTVSFSPDTGSDPPSAFTKATGDDIDTKLQAYWSSSRSHIPLMWRALMDRGANGCILGKDVRVIHRYGQFIDLSGIDDHTVQNLQLATAAAYILTDHGPIIGLIHQGAAMSNGKTILSPGQLEHFGCRVHDKALTVTGLDPYFVTPNGFRVPMAIKSGLPYVQLRPPTDQELSDSSIPHVDLTSPHAWDPSCLDSVPADDWFTQQDNTLYDDGEFPLDPLGRLRAFDDDFIDHSDRQNQSIDRRGIVEAMAHIISDEIDLPPLLERESHGYDSDSSDDSDGYASDPDPIWQCHVQTRAQRRRRHSPPSTPLAAPLSSGAGEDCSGPPSTQARPKVETVSDDEDMEPLRSNNKAKHHTGLEFPPKSKKIKTQSPAKLRRFFPGVTDETIKRTLDATTQYGTKGATQGRTLRGQIVSPNPILNIPRCHEDVATDTIYSSTPAVDDGSTAAQLFIGRTSHYRTLRPAGSSDASYIRNLMDEIRKLGAMNRIRSDNC
ncbi:Retrotransposon protein [Seminavis robusta]|uniref:Retrotransposon protein n=1 Tax=Seminavis robusta TaxID=568900 RepID=A0A9N8EZ71_9STRA|nr:Retrotransposon protein [Seminavis robusta]|eukprot:Sro2626_g332960.1 Retrotransposon protein (1227) ;mRNA; f:4391-8574